MSRIKIGTGVLVLLTAALAGLAVLLSSCGGASASMPGGSKTIYMSAMEYKGGTEVSKEAFPTAKLPEGGGYGLKEPAGETQRWEVNSYAWAPSTVVVVEGDQVTLEIIGINGAAHPSNIEGHAVSFDVKRGQITTVKFTAGKPGVYKIVCDAHLPGMVGQLVVLPKK
jgi:plastocyanin